VETAERVLAGTASEIAAAVQQGARDPVDVVTDCLARIQRHDRVLGAFPRLRADEAMREAVEIREHANRSELPLAGVPVAIKDNIGVAGEVQHAGSHVFDPEPAGSDHVVTERLRSAGAVVVGLTSTPELGLWLTTDGDVITRNPWNCDYSASGSSGGSAAAVGSGLVPISHGNDGLGSIRQPAEACGIVGLKPSRALVPSGLASDNWYGLAENGPMATTVADLALMLSVMAARPDLANVTEPQGLLRVAASVRPPVHGVRVDPEITRAVFAVAGLLRREGHIVERAQPAYPKRLGLAGTFRWMAVAADAVDAVDAASAANGRGGFQGRTLGHASAGRRVRPLVTDDQLSDWQARAETFFDSYDVMLTPVTATPPLLAERWSERSWTTNVRANVTASGGFAGMWNVAGFPAITVPFGLHPVSRTPIGIQLATRAGGEALLLGVAAMVERIHPWTRIAPGWV